MGLGSCCDVLKMYVGIGSRCGSPTWQYNLAFIWSSDGTLYVHLALIWRPKGPKLAQEATKGSQVESKRRPERPKMSPKAVQEVTS